MEQIVQSATLSQENCSAKIVEARDTIESDLKTKSDALKAQVVQNNLDQLEATYQALIDGVAC